MIPATKTGPRSEAAVPASEPKSWADSWSERAARYHAVEHPLVARSLDRREASPPHAPA
jgi:hypothetical protein